MARASTPSAVSRAEFLKQMQNHALSGAWLLEGSDAALRDEAIQAARAAFLAPGMEELDCAVLEAPAADAVIAACETVPFLSEKRIVIAAPPHPRVTRSCANTCPRRPPPAWPSSSTARARTGASRWSRRWRS